MIATYYCKSVKQYSLIKLKGDGISKASKLDMYQRHQEILKMIGEGYNSSTIKRELARIFKVSESAIEKTYYQVLRAIHNQSSLERDALRAGLMARNETIYQKAITERKYKVALEANMAQAKLAGLLDEAKEASELPKIIEVSERTPDKIEGSQDEPESSD